jgi:uracil phosphoribosyltransferase
MKTILISQLRNKNTGMAQFREASDKLALILASEIASFLEKETIEIETPLAKTKGVRFKRPHVLIPILRSGLALLPAFIRFFPEAKVGFLGMRRDEATAVPHMYYHNLPKLNTRDQIVLLEPMIASGGSVSLAIDYLKQAKVKEENILVATFFAASQGLKEIKAYAPKTHVHAMQIDEELNPMVFSDRFFGTESAF